MKTCSICHHPKKDEIEKALLISKRSYRDISGRFNVSKLALQRHQEKHVPSHLIKAEQAAEICRADGLLNKLVILKNDAERITEKAEINDDLKTALSGIREQSRIIEILSKMQGQIQQPQIKLTMNQIGLLKIHYRLSRKLESFIEPSSCIKTEVF